MGTVGKNYLKERGEWVLLRGGVVGGKEGGK